MITVHDIKEYQRIDDALSATIMELDLAPGSIVKYYFDDEWVHVEYYETWNYGGEETHYRKIRIRDLVRLDTNEKVSEYVKRRKRIEKILEDYAFKKKRLKELQSKANQIANQIKELQTE